MASIHAVKGQEWPHVVVHDVTVGVLPHRLADDLEEERRILHVAITRASRSTTVVAGEPASVFVSEMLTQWKPTVDKADATGSLNPTGLDPVREAASAALREWRKSRAQAEKKPAYIYLTDETIRAISAALPADIKGLSDVKGLGPAKLQAYGAEILSLLDGVRKH
ncbi:MAG: HRDC domain-containing protein [Acidimicrobiales bacterium]